MHRVNNPLYVEQNYSPLRTNNRTYYQQSIRNKQQFDNRTTSQRYKNKTQQRKPKSISPLAIKAINQQIYQIIHMDSYTIEQSLKNSAKKIYGLINNQLLLNIKQLSSMKLFLYNTILMYIDQSSRNCQQRIKAKQREKSYSINSMKNPSNSRQKDIASNFQQISINTGRDLHSIKQTVPFIPKDKSKVLKNTQSEVMQQQLTNKIQSTKQALENILKKIQHYSNYRLNGEDIMRLKKSVIDVSQLKPSNFLSLNNLNPTIPLNSQKNPSFNRQSSKQSRKPFNASTQKKSMARNDSRSKTCNNGFLNSQSPSRVQEHQSGDQGNELLIQQLQQIIERKQNRIKQLTKQLSKNLSEQKQFQNTIENLEIQVQQIQNQRKNFQQIIQKLQQQNLNYQIQIKQLKQTYLVRKQVQKSNGDHLEQNSNYEYLKEMQKRQKIMKLYIRKQLDQKIQNKGYNSTSISQQKWKQVNSISVGSGSGGFNDISEITPKRLNKKILLGNDIEDQYGQQITTRKNLANSQNTNKNNYNQKKNTSFNKFQMLTDKTQKNKNNTTGESREDFKELQRENFQKMLFLQALTIEQLLVDL